MQRMTTRDRVLALISLAGDEGTTVKAIAKEIGVERSSVGMAALQLHEAGAVYREAEPSQPWRWRPIEYRYWAEE